MAITVSNPTVWSSRILEYLDKLSVYRAALTNNNYEGDVTIGGTVKAFYVEDITVDNYTGAWTDGDWSELTDVEVEFAITQKKKFLFKVKDVDEEMSAIRLIDQGSERAAYAVRDQIDQYIAAKYAQVDTALEYGDDTTPITVGLDTAGGDIPPTLALAHLVETLVDANAPSGNLRVVIPSWMGTMLLRELGPNRASIAGDEYLQSGVAQGLIAANVAGFDQIYVSGNVPNTTGTKYKVLAGQPQIVFASAIDKIETVRLQNDFATGVKGLFVYDCKLMRPEIMALGTFNKGSYE